MKIKKIEDLLEIINAITDRKYQLDQNGDCFTLKQDEHVIFTSNYESCAYVVIGMYIVARELKGGKTCKD